MQENLIQIFNFKLASYRKFRYRNFQEEVRQQTGSSRVLEMVKVLVHTLYGKLYMLVAQALLMPLQSVLKNFYLPVNEDNESNIIETILDSCYLRSQFCQQHFNFRLNYHNFERHIVSELLTLHAKCSAFFEEHIIEERGICLCKFYVRNNTTKVRGVVVCVPGIGQNMDTFICGGKYSLVRHLLASGYEVWLVNCMRTFATKDTPGELESPALFNNTINLKEHTRVAAVAAYQFAVLDLLAVARYAGEGNANLPVNWVGHSSACNDLLSALSYSCCYHQSADKAASIALRQITRSVVLLSPLLTLAHLHPRYNAQDAKIGTQPALGATLPLLEGLLCDPDSVNEFLGAPLLATSLLLWRDLLRPATYACFISALSRCWLGWKHDNISPVRRCEYLPHLFAPTPTEHLLALLRGTASAAAAGGGGRNNIRGAGLFTLCFYNVRALLRWSVCFSCIALDVAFGVTRALLRRTPQISTASSTTPAPRTVTSTSQMKSKIDEKQTFFGSYNSIKDEDSTPSSRLCVTAIVGERDALCSHRELEQRLLVLGKELNKQGCVFQNDLHVVAGYEHMDTLWADDVADVVFARVSDSFARA